MTAPLSIQIKQESAEVERLLRGLGRGADQVIFRALKRTLASVATGTKGKPSAAKAIAGDLGVAQKHVKKSLKQAQPNINNRRAAIVATGKRLPLIAFNSSQTNRGVTYQAKGGGRKLIPGGFKAEMQSGHQGVFKRFGAKRRMRKGRHAGTIREPIVELHGPSVPYIMLKRAIKIAMDNKGAERWPIEIRQQLQNFIRSRRRG